MIEFELQSAKSDSEVDFLDTYTKMLHQFYCYFSFLLFFFLKLDDLLMQTWLLLHSAMT